VIFADTGIRTVAVYGGVGYKKQMDALREGAQVIVGTPGRVLDHLLRRTLDLKDLRVLVFDEADRMLSIGFYPDMKEVQRYLPKKRIHTCLFSATYPPHVLKLAAEFMSEPALLSLSQKEVHVAEVQHLFCEVKPMDKDRALVRLLETENPASAIIFCNTKANVHYVTGVLQGFGYSADELSADLQYLYHSFIFKGRCDDETADILIGIAITEMHHLDILGNMLLKLGADPVYVTAYPPNGFNFFSASAISYSKSVRKMLMDDLAGELCAIENYDKILCKLCNEEVSAVIARIKLDEELHVRVLKERMNALFCDIR